jgi:hypothetical protein
MIAITVSTNYSDLLPIVYHHNKDYFKHWVFVTDKNDQETINFLSTKPNVTILFWDFQNHRRLFDKGGAICHAQSYVYEKFPDDWYLLIDSDICLPHLFNKFIEEGLKTLDEGLIYGLNDRFDYSSYDDFLLGRNEVRYTNWKYAYVAGYFQLYKKKYYYSSSRNAGSCDIEFTLYFKKGILINGLPCAHLGRKSNWDGNRSLGSDFIIDKKQ